MPLAMLSLAVAGATLLSSTLAASTSPAQCTSYLVNATDSTWKFNHYKFLDFRNQSSSYTSSSDFTSQYSAQAWKNSKFANLAENVAMTSDTIDGEEVSMLSLYARQKGSQATAAELDSVGNDFYYASVRIGARVTGASGACAGLFFYHNDTQETDIEILTREQTTHADAETQLQAGPTTSQLHFTNQPHYTATVDLIPASGGDDNSDATWTNLNAYRIDWVPGMTYWWQNGIMSHTADKQVIEAPSAWLMNIWSNGDEYWSGSMAPDTEARLDILWIEMVYNKYSEGKPEQLDSSAYTGSCAVGDGDGTALGETKPDTTTTDDSDSAAQASDEDVTESDDGKPSTYEKRVAVKFSA